MEKKSIYYFIQNVLKSVPGTPYSFQNSLVNGFNDVSYLGLNRFDLNISGYTGGVSDDIQINYKDKELHSKNLLDLIQLTIDDPDYYNSLLDFLYKTRLYSYMDVFMPRVRNYIESDEIDSESLYNLGLNFAMESHDYELVSLGILILGFFENDFSSKILKVLGYHSIFTSYVIEAYRYFRNTNDLVFDLAKNTLSFGKIISLLNLSPITIEQMDWLIEEGGKDENFPEICSAVVLSKPELNDYLTDYVDDEQYIGSISHLFAYGVSNDYFENGEWTKYAFEIYCKMAKEKSDFITLMAFISIENNLRKKIDINPEISLVDGWDFGRNFLMSRMCNDVIKNKSWEKTVMNALVKAEYSPELIVRALEKLNMLPEFKDFKAVLDEYRFHPKIGEFLLKKNPSIYTRDALNYTKSELENIFSEYMPDPFGRISFSSDEFENNWILHLLNAMRHMNINDENFFLNCLKSKKASIRIAAAKCLGNFVKGWSNEVMPILEDLIRKDSDGQVRRELHSLITSGKSAVKMNKTVDVSNININVSENDIPIFEACIVGTFYHDLTEAFEQVKKGSILYLVKISQKSNHIDIAVTTENGYVIGYIPNEDTDLILPLLDSGNLIYGVFSSKNLDDKCPNITILMNEETYRNKGVIPMSFNRLNND